MRAGRGPLSPHSASFKLEVDRHWQRGEPGVFPSAQHQCHSAASHIMGTGRKESKCRHQTALLAPRDTTRELRRSHHGTLHQHPPTLGESCWRLSRASRREVTLLTKTPLRLGDSHVLPSCQLPCKVSEVSGLLYGQPHVAQAMRYWAATWGDMWWEVGCRSPQTSRWSGSTEIPSGHWSSSFLAT